jgi:acyl-coenzyme A thioesterase PaaI-like protein
MKKVSIQDHYPEELSHCYGCGSLNEYGHQLKSYWENGESVAIFEPKPYHIAIPGYVYGGLIASLIDCHGTGTAAAAMYSNQSRGMDTDPPLRFVTASLHVDYLKPTPLEVTLELRGKAIEIKTRKVVVEVTLSTNAEVCAKGKVVAVRMPDNMMDN